RRRSARACAPCPLPRGQRPREVPCAGPAARRPDRPVRRRHREGPDAVSTPAPAPASASAPTPATRYVPTRARIGNLCDYRDEESSVAGGWLVLRGPNGSGKTKALEVVFPFVLDGRIDPKRLNPFAAEDRTMKSNLLFRGQDSALGYVWIEFTHRTSG